MSRRTTLTWATVALLAVTLLAGQVAADRAAPEEGIAPTGRLVGRAGFAYLAGIRTFAAAVLWNRIDPQFHDYYGASLQQGEFMLPTLRIVTWLDPQFVQAYWVAPWIIRTRLGKEEESTRLALEGVENNPRSGLLLAQVAQLHLMDGDLDAALGYAERALGDEVDWSDVIEQHDSYAILRSVFITVERTDLIAVVEEELARIDREIEHLHGEDALEDLHEGHDHDH